MIVRRGFTLIELLVVVAVIGALATIILMNFGSSSAQVRDAERKTDLRALQGALERYKQANGRYPEGCNNPASNQGTIAAWQGGSAYWSGEPDTIYNCPSNEGSYIVGLAPEFIPTLPRDPRRNGNDSGYVYITNPDGTVYKLMALNTVESETVYNGTEPDPSNAFARLPASTFSRCGDWTQGDATPTDYTDDNICKAIRSSPTDDRAYNSINNSTPAHCVVASQYSDDYAVSEGFVPGAWRFGTYMTNPGAREHFTDAIRCS